MLIKKLLFYFAAFLILAASAELLLRAAGYIYMERYYHLGEPDTLPPESINIVTLGESSTAGLWVDGNDSYPLQLQSMLREHHNNHQIRAIIPPHIGHNTSQMANRIKSYLKSYKPRLLIMMMGVNNQYSWAESHVGKFLKQNSLDQYKIKGLIFFSELRLFKVLNYVYLAFIKKEDSEYVRGLENTKYVFGGPEIAKWPPKKYITSLASSNIAAIS